MNLEAEVEEIVRVNKGRWEIEESFRIMKDDFDARPVCGSGGSHGLRDPEKASHARYDPPIKRPVYYPLREKV